MQKTKILAWGDYACSTGFGVVMSNIMRELDKTGKYDIDVVGINYDGTPYDMDKWPGRVWPALNALRMQGNYGDVFGRQLVLDKLSTGEYDVLFMLQDTFIVQAFMEQLMQIREKHPHPFRIVYYYPIDAAPKKDWIEEVVAKLDFPVAYTNYAKEETLKFAPNLKLDVIYHGTNLDDFFYEEDRDKVREFRKGYFGELSDRFIVTNVNRNQSRKDIVRNFMILNELRRRGDDSVIYFHMQHEDVGGNLLVMADHFGLERGKDYLFPNPKGFTAHQGFPTEVVNAIYNASDCLLTTTLGEGWGLSITEAMATKLPIVAPAHTSLNEMIGEDRGWLVPAGNTPSLWNLKEMDNERLRPLMDVERAADAILEVKKGTDKQKKIDNAYSWVRQLSWSEVCKEWLRIIDKAAADAKAAQAFMTMPLNREQRRKMAKK